MGRHTAPTKPSISGPAKVGPTVHHFAGGGATDNTGVSDYRYFLDGVDEGASATGFDVDVASLSAGTHELTARARDAAGNESTASDAFAFTVDRSAAVSFTSPAAGGHFKAAPTFNFTHDGDVGEIVCQTLDAGSAVVHESSCSTRTRPRPAATATTAPGSSSPTTWATRPPPRAGSSSTRAIRTSSSPRRPRAST